jgi:hypothetical protein
MSDWRSLTASRRRGPDRAGSEAALARRWPRSPSGPPGDASPSRSTGLARRAAAAGLVRRGMPTCRSSPAGRPGGRRRISAQHRGAVEVCAAVNLLNYVAGNVGRTVRFGQDLQSGDGWAGMQALQRAMEVGEVAVLIVHEANPVYALPRAGKFPTPRQGAVQGLVPPRRTSAPRPAPAGHHAGRWTTGAARRWSLMEPVVEPVFDHGDRRPAPVAGRRVGAGRVHRADEAHLMEAWLAGCTAPPRGFWRESWPGRGLDEVAGEARLAPRLPPPSRHRRSDAWGVHLVAYPRRCTDGRGATGLAARNPTPSPR